MTSPVNTPPHAPTRTAPPGWVLSATALGLFIVWSNSFIAMSFLLGGERTPQRLDWIDLTVARFVLAGSVSGLYLACARRRESWELLRRHPLRLLLCGLFAVPAYNFALYYAQQNGVSPPIASLTTALTPLFIVLLSAAFLGERLTRQKTSGLLVACVGMWVVASARGDLRADYPWMVGVAALAPLSWSLFTILSKPIAGKASPLVWSYLALALGMLFVLPGLPRAWPRIIELDSSGWGALLYLVLPCAVMGNAVWTWLLRHLPANTVGFTAFLNPPLTTLSKALLTALLPSVFVFSIVPREWIGAAIVLLGLAIGLFRAGRWPRRGS